MPASKFIQSRDNPLFKTLLKLSKSAPERRKQSATLLDGAHLIESFSAAGHAIEALVLSETGAKRPELQRLFERIDARQRVQLSDPLFHDIAAVTTPTGIMALVDTPKPTAEPAIDVDSVLLETVQDPGNLGSILRSAAAAGIEQVLLSKGSVFAWSPRTLRAGMGAHFALRVFEDCDLSAFSARFKGQCIATDLQAKQSLFEAPLNSPVAWMFGNEGAGLSTELAQRAHLRVRIPMPGQAESLNVAAAAAICLFENVRRRQ
ncbi:MAG TPA: RNA methyltransferase [Burkholderiales bacterium]|nr:RNA methyltransferase [Burkholderiales bacterium]